MLDRIKSLPNTTKITIAAIAVVLLALPLTLSLSQKQQNLTQNAASVGGTQGSTCSPPNTQVCAGNSAQSCGSTGKWGAPNPCPTGSTCQDHNANPKITSGQVSCISNCQVSGAGVCRQSCLSYQTINNSYKCALGTPQTAGQVCCSPANPPPTQAPTSQPTAQPTQQPTAQPTASPSPTPQGVSCTLSANPQSVNPSDNSSVSATCSGNPTSFQWTTSC